MSDLIGRRLPLAEVLGEWVRGIHWYAATVDAYGQHYLYPEARGDEAAKAIAKVEKYATCIDLDRGRMPYPPEWMLRIEPGDLAQLAEATS